ncbi:DNA methyltransferase [Sphingomonas koreensis]|uniref:DNA methyltransferase n=1 Tax=Sphingomonas koreensis TaxID=93064 RepID=UPI000F7E01AB|nr:DNA methyltransferase [Sphingomonas koreensis]RSU21219.1 DNA methylase N-4 [Sphingomonas koreensis]RSU32216.1 DNA methylase N-4 [Sphingomonas koreensis]RSU35710.1 DNA methylase N-4 [Sphingomonas koreensis]RSU49881.1 DNA methylase N-4 [Sphingomonas koreensis]RSU83478.1 DNA methylase N-4 [Sphingomonas koreensis]
MRHAGALKATTAAQPLDYLDFVRAKIITLPPLGLPVAANDVHPVLKPHQAAIVCWAVEGGRRAIFAAFGLGKSLIQLEIMRQLARQLGGRQLIVVPLTVVTEFMRDAQLLGMAPVFVRTTEEVLRFTPPPVGKTRSGEDGAKGSLGTGDPPVLDQAPHLFLTNYESVREGKIDLSLFNAASLDEASCLRGFGGTKTFREFMRLFDGMKYKFVATATPSPNEYVELLAYAAFLEIMDVGQAKTRFFKRNSEQADDLTIHPHKVDEWWLWVNSWAAFVQRPSDLGFSDEGYELPDLDVRWHEVPSDHAAAGEEKGGQGLLLKKEAIGLVDASREKRESLDARIAKMMALRAEDPGAHRLIWHDLEKEREAIERAVPNVVSIYGAQDLGERARKIIAFSDGEVQELAAKPVLAGSGCNFQRHCSWAIFLGIGFKFNDFIQAIHRIQRFLQTKQVRIDLIYSEAERAVRRTLEEKWARHKEMTARMSEIIRQYGLGLAGAADVLERTVQDRAFNKNEVADVRGEPPQWMAWQGDSVLLTRELPSESVGLIVTSVPFGSQYEYSPSYNDFGHTDDLDHFFAQMDFLTPELLRVLEPGRRLAVHVKDRVVPSGMTGLGFRTIEPFHARCIEHYRAHGFAYLGMITIVTDVVRENAGTYRLGWSEQCKDASGMGVGLPEYLLLFRKPPSDRSNGYADDPVVKGKPMVELESGEIVEWDDPRAKAAGKSRTCHLVPDSGYSRSRWQIDACSLYRSSGNRALTAADLEGIDHKSIYRRFRALNYAAVYDHEAHVALTESVEARHALPTEFALLPPHSWHPDVWTDVARMRGANTMQSEKGREQHLCPLPFDIVDRAIKNWSNPGDLVFDPFGGLMTVPLRAVKHGRRGAAVELNADYFRDGVSLLREQDAGRATPSLFDLLDMEAA